MAAKDVPTKFCALTPRGSEGDRDLFWANQSIYRAWDRLRGHCHDYESPMSVGSLRKRVEDLGSPFAMDGASRDKWLEFLREVRFVADEARRAGLKLKPLSDPTAVDRRVYATARR